MFNMEEDEIMKYKQRLFIISLIIMALTIACNNKDNKLDIIPPEEDKTKIRSEDMVIEEEIMVDNALELIKAMTLKEKIGQLIIVGFDGTNINEESLDYIENLKVGGFILFSRNIVDEEGTLNLLNDLKESNSNNDVPLFLSIDEEGGRVSRLPKSFVKIPEMMKIGNMNDENLSYEIGRILGERVKSLGFNMNFAPVLDINSNPNNPVIGTRAFGSTIESVTQNGLRVMNGIRDVNVIPAVKHFPGHGDTNVDSHINLPIIRKSMDEIKSFELLPFIKAIEEDVEMIMVAHILYSELDENYPSTMSPKIIEGLLRKKLGYEGVIVSDDMTMGAIVENYTLEEGVLSFLKAGGDIALVCHGRENPGKVIGRIEAAVNNGELSEEEIDEKLYRILKLKEKYDLKDNIIDEIKLDDLNDKTKRIIEGIN